MKIKTSKRLSKAIIIAVSLLAFLLLSYTVAAAVYKLYPFNSSVEAPNTSQDSEEVTEGFNYEEPTDEQIQAGQQTKEEFIDKNYDNDNSETPKEQIAITITNKGVSNGYYQIRTILSAAKSDGGCTLTLSSPGKNNIVKTSGVQDLGTYWVCNSYFDVLVSDLGTAKWVAVLTYEDSSNSGKTQFEVQQ